MRVLVVAVAHAILCSAARSRDADAPWPTWTTILEVPTTAHGRLAGNWLVTGVGCDGRRFGVASPRSGAFIGGALAAALGVGDCAAACLTTGAPLALLDAAAAARRWAGAGEGGGAEAWYARACATVEVGWVTGGPPVDVFWVAPDDGARRFEAAVETGEGAAVWRSVGLGHRFVAVDRKTGEDAREFVAAHDAIYVIENSASPAAAPAAGRGDAYWAAQINATAAYEATRAKKVRRTWTRRGYGRAPLPPGLWADVATYWHNNRDALFFEEWESHSAYVNWWTVRGPGVPAFF